MPLAKKIIFKKLMKDRELFQKAIKAILISLIAMFIYIAWRFQFKQAVSSILALMHDVIVSVGIFVISGREFSLPIVAAILTIVGYSINDTIVIFDRIRENLKIYRKEEFAKVVNMSINQTFGRTIITSFTAILTVFALYLFGGRAINDFAFILLVGFISGVYSTVFVAGPLLVDWSKKRA